MQNTVGQNRLGWPPTAVRRSDAPCALLVGGDGPTRLMLRYLLNRDGCTVREAARGQTPLAVVPPRYSTLLLVIVADTIQPVQGTVAALRRRGHYTATVVLTHAATPLLRRQAGALGVRDVIPWPAEAHELRTRLRVALGYDVSVAPAAPPLPTIAAGGLLLDTAARAVQTATGEVAHLTRHEAALLGVLMRQPGQSVPRQTLLDGVWGEDAAPHINALNVCVHHVCRKLARTRAEHGYIHAVRGQGYVFEAPSPYPASCGATASERATAWALARQDRRSDGR